VAVEVKDEDDSYIWPVEPSLFIIMYLTISFCSFRGACLRWDLSCLALVFSAWMMSDCQ
jgi:hypothetical protein